MCFALSSFEDTSMLVLSAHHTLRVGILGLPPLPTGSFMYLFAIHISCSVASSRKSCQCLDFVSSMHLAKALWCSFRSVWVAWSVNAQYLYDCLLSRLPIWRICDSSVIHHHLDVGKGFVIRTCLSMASCKMLVSHSACELNCASSVMGPQLLSACLALMCSLNLGQSASLKLGRSGEEASCLVTFRMISMGMWSVHGSLCSGITLHFRT